MVKSYVPRFLDGHTFSMVGHAFSMTRIYYDPRPVLVNKTRELGHLFEAPKGWVPLVYLFYLVPFFLVIQGGRTPNSGSATLGTCDFI